MSELFLPGDGVLFMKVGTHANEGLGDIVARKKAEIENAGMAMWGYGGNTCHPTSMVQPFAQRYERDDRPIILCMKPMTSKHFAEPLRATEFSVDGTFWEEIPAAINVLGSRYALCIDDLAEVDDSLDLSSTQVAIGNSKGKPGINYIRGRVDKACLEVAGPPGDGAGLVEIRLVARIVKPYAVFLRD